MSDKADYEITEGDTLPAIQAQLKGEDGHNQGLLPDDDVITLYVRPSGGRGQVTSTLCEVTHAQTGKIESPPIEGLTAAGAYAGRYEAQFRAVLAPRDEGDPTHTLTFPNNGKLFILVHPAITPPEDDEESA